MTEFDKKLLFELDKDARASFTDIAKTLGTSPQVVKYHFQNLQDDGVLEHIWAFVDYDKAGYHVFWGYWLKFVGLTKEIETAMYADLVSNKNIPIVLRTDGYADAMIGIIGKDVFEHNKILQSVFATYGKYIASNDIVIGLTFKKFPRTYLIGTENLEGERTTSGGSTEEVKLSEIDRKILSLLQMDGRMEFTKMAQKIGTTPGLVQKHYAQLVKQEVITKITYTPNFEKMEMVLYRVLLKIGAFDSERVASLYTFCKKHPNIISYVKTMGNWQMMLDVEIENRAKLRDVLRVIKQEFKDLIFQIEVNEVYKMDKFTQMAIEYSELN